jgi:hypothetical protein
MITSLIKFNIDGKNFTTNSKSLNTSQFLAFDTFCSCIVYNILYIFI